ncbi:ATP-binding protein, partial [Cyanobium sp. Cruz-8H5]|uniref:ATP-binding protein n=1 Tax=Cyanobium sp. Cruz-8H5 TaxID=2823712 RepID=UPI0020CCA4D8
EEFAADLGSVTSGKEVKEYSDPALFFQNTYPTRGLKALLTTVCSRLSGVGGGLDSIIRLDTQFGGGKTHGLIALIHAVRGMKGVSNASEFVDPSLLPRGKVRIAALTGESADPANGLKLEAGLHARSLWGEMAYQLAGREGFERIRQSDEQHIAPGDTTIAELFGGEPTLIVIDEVAVYLRKVSAVFPDATNQFAAFVHALIKAVSSNPKVALVFTLAVGSDDKQGKDAYKAEQSIALRAFDEVDRVAARKATQLNPTEEDETVNIISRRLFSRIDLEAARPVIEAYCDLWERNRDSMSAQAFSPKTKEQFLAGYPLHPETLNTLIQKTSSLSNFQRTRGMLRLLSRMVRQLWQTRPADAHAIHPHHIDLAYEPIRNELTTRLGQQMYATALATDVAAVPGKSPAVAQRLDADHFPGQPPVALYVATTIFLHTLAYPESVQGIAYDHLRYSVCSPAIDPSFVESARKLFVADSLYLDDRPGAPHRFRVEANLTQMIRKAMDNVDADEVRTQLNERLRILFDGRGQNLELIAFPSGPYEVPDEINDGRPYLVLLGYDAFAVSDEPTSLPADIVRMFQKKGTKEELRSYLNNLVFVVADERYREDMKHAVRRKLALAELKQPERMRELADHQQRKLNEDYGSSDFQIAQAVMQCYRHLFYPSQNAVGGGTVQLGHTAIELANVSSDPGNGQNHIRRTLRDQKKLLESGDQPDAPGFVRDQTPLKTKGVISTQELRNEFRRAPKLSILMDNGPLLNCIRQGIEAGVFVYKQGELVWGKGDPMPSITISDNAFVYTLAEANRAGLWPRPPKPEPEPSKPLLPPSGGGPSSGGGGVSAPQPPPPPPKPALHASGPLKQALIELFEIARKSKVSALQKICFKLYEPSPAWMIHQAVATFRDATVTCQFSVQIEAEGIDAFQIEFTGNVAKANPVKSFIDTQLRAGTNHSFEGQYTLSFAAPLPTTADRADPFISAMTKYGGGEAFVEADAAAQEGS